MRVDAGVLNKRIVISETEIAKDSDGIKTETLKTIHSCWAKVSNTSGTEATKTGATFADLNTRFMIRYTDKQIHPKHVIVFAGNRYNIEYVNNYGYSNEYIEIMAKVNVQAGR